MGDFFAIMGWRFAWQWPVDVVVAMFSTVGANTRYSRMEKRMFRGKWRDAAWEGM